MVAFDLALLDSLDFARKADLTSHKKTALADERKLYFWFCLTLMYSASFTLNGHVDFESRECASSPPWIIPRIIFII